MQRIINYENNGNLRPKSDRISFGVTKNVTLKSNKDYTRLYSIADQGFGKWDGMETVTTYYSLIHKPTNIWNNRFLLIFCTFGNAYAHFHIPTQINDLLGPSGRENRFGNIQFSKNLQGFFGSASCKTTAKIETVWNMPHGGSGEGLLNPSIHLDSISKVEHSNKLWSLVYYKMKYVPLNWAIMAYILTERYNTIISMC